MGSITLRVLGLAPVLALLGIGASAPKAAVKCGGAPIPGGKAIVAIDGVIRQPADSAAPMPGNDDIYRIDVICLNPADSTFNRTRGWGLVSIWTKRGPAPRVEEALDVIREAQDTHRAKSGAYILALEEIRFPEPMKPVRITMVADKSGWIARSTLPRLLQTCTMFDGAVAEPTRNEPRQATCVSDP